MSRRRQKKDIALAFGEVVRARRKELGMSQEQLGFKAELDRTYISGVERGVRNPSLRIVDSLAKALGSTAGSLLTEAE